MFHPLLQSKISDDFHVPVQQLDIRLNYLQIKSSLLLVSSSSEIAMKSSVVSGAVNATEGLWLGSFKSYDKTNGQNCACA